MLIPWKMIAKKVIPIVASEVLYYMVNQPTKKSVYKKPSYKVFIKPRKGRKF